MYSKNQLPRLSDWQPTKRTLHAYARAMGVIPRVHAEFHPKWWHISLKVRPNGLVTDDMALPGGGRFRLRLDLTQHLLMLSTSKGFGRAFSLVDGLTSTEFGDQLLNATAKLGLKGEYPRERYKDDSPREYNPEVAERYFAALTTISQVFEQHRSTLDGKKGPVQLWPHGFDLAFEWFGSRVETSEENGKIKTYPSQLNLGFAPGDDNNEPYFYSNPWPFETEALVNKPLPKGASWHLESWQGTILPYAELAQAENAVGRLSEYARAVYEIAAPTLQA